jgi:Pyridoxine 5'-phosphate oxidase C-terminal dimerisation region
MPEKNHEVAPVKDEQGSARRLACLIEEADALSAALAEHQERELSEARAQLEEALRLQREITSIRADLAAGRLTSEQADYRTGAVEASVAVASLPQPNERCARISSKRASLRAFQARVEGRVEHVSDQEDDRHWQQREGRRQLAAFRQSEPVESRQALLEKLAAVPESPERPQFWRGYRVLPERFEFWIADEDYVHDRFEYLRRVDSWQRRRLQP